MDLREALPIILLAGPTAVGKTALSLELAHCLNTEIVNADSMQIYRYMDIGTAKPTPEERALAPHHLLDIVDPDEPFDAARYLDLAKPVVDALHAKGKIPLVVGGTGLYMKILTRGICPAAPGDPAVREQLQAEEERRGLAAMHAELVNSDPRLGARIHPNDRQRILRALEVFRITGIPLSQWQEQHRFEQTVYPGIKVFLYRDRRELYQRIDERVLQMMDVGFLEEVQGLMAKGYGPELKPMQSLGYKQIVRHLLGKCTHVEAVQEIQRETRRYAKRQMTWFRGDPDFRWFDVSCGKEILAWIKGSANMP
jgi:tRNA dimethylallyltransferase